MVNRYEAHLDRVFHALADPTRRRILLRVAKSSCTVAELAEPFSISAPAISRHLKVLENARMIERVKTGKFHRFRVNTRPLGQAQRMLQQLTDFWNRRLDNLEDFLQNEIGKTN
ncbi:MAG TPA: metalloregulator ArsR/SmtB family transcription factor [Candidatus Binatia bacterium]|jgi:DNA-binding transcriptional ArsR family regulator|nr:metalloregulator ArsR/SmtB family transcription factor [Candidatus Binatia bacterium]